MSDIVQIIAAILGSLGFGIVFKMKRRRLAFACIGGGITWTVYLICIAHGQSLFMANFIATLFASVFSIIVARFTKTPEIIYIITSVVPLIPGSSLYYALSALVERNEDLTIKYAIQTGVVAAAIAFGILLFTVLYNVVLRTVIHLKR